MNFELICLIYEHKLLTMICLGWIEYIGTICFVMGIKSIIYYIYIKMPLNK